VVILIVVLLFFVSNYNDSVNINKVTDKTDTINDPGFLNDLDAISNDANYDNLNSDIIKVE
jgi:hypothetical protein